MDFLDDFFEDQSTHFTHQIDFRYKSFEIPEGFEEGVDGDAGGSYDNGQSRRTLCNSYNSYGYLVKKQNEILAVLKEQEPIALDEDKDHLIPIKLEIELDNEIKLRDCFTWNLNEYDITPEKFAEIMVSEWDLNSYNIQFNPANPMLQPGALVTAISDSIKQQVAAFSMAVEQEDYGVPHIDFNTIRDNYPEWDGKIASVKVDLAKEQAEDNGSNSADDNEEDLSMMDIDVLDPNGNPLDVDGDGEDDQKIRGKGKTSLPNEEYDVVSALQQLHDSPPPKKRMEPKSVTEETDSKLVADGESAENVDLEKPKVFKTIIEMRKESQKQKEDPGEPAYGDIRIVVKIDVNVGTLYLRDQFEWPLFEVGVTPEEFSKQLCCDVGLGGEFVNLVATSIREQVVLARLNFDDAFQAPLYSRYLRAIDDGGWEPDVRFLNNASVAALAKEDERNSRRMRRQRQNIGAATAAGNRGDGRRKGDAPITKLAAAQNMYLDLNRLVSSSFVEEENDDNRVVIPVEAETALRQPIYIDHPPPSNLTINPTTIAQQLAMLQENAALLKIDIAIPPPSSSPTGFHPSKPSEWRCTWCFVQQIYTPTIRRGPLGPRTVCQPCGIWYSKSGVLPIERWKTCRDGPI